MSVSFHSASRFVFQILYVICDLLGYKYVESRLIFLSKLATGAHKTEIAIFGITG